MGGLTNVIRGGGITQTSQFSAVSALCEDAVVTEGERWTGQSPSWLQARWSARSQVPAAWAAHGAVVPASGAPRSSTPRQGGGPGAVRNGRSRSAEPVRGSGTQLCPRSDASSLCVCRAASRALPAPQKRAPAEGPGRSRGRGLSAAARAMARCGLVSAGLRQAGGEPAGSSGLAQKSSWSQQLQKMAWCRTAVPSPASDGCVDLGLVIPESRCQTAAGWGCVQGSGRVVSLPGEIYRVQTEAVAFARMSISRGLRISHPPLTP